MLYLLYIRRGEFMKKLYLLIIIIMFLLVKVNNVNAADSDVNEALIYCKYKYHQSNLNDPSALTAIQVTYYPYTSKIKASLLGSYASDQYYLQFADSVNKYKEMCPETIFFVISQEHTLEGSSYIYAGDSTLLGKDDITSKPIANTKVWYAQLASISYAMATVPGGISSGYATEFNNSFQTLTMEQYADINISLTNACSGFPPLYSSGEGLSQITLPYDLTTFYQYNDSFDYHSLSYCYSFRTQYEATEKNSDKLNYLLGGICGSSFSTLNAYIYQGFLDAINTGETLLSNDINTLFYNARIAALKYLDYGRSDACGVIYDQILSKKAVSLYNAVGTYSKDKPSEGNAPTDPIENAKYVVSNITDTETKDLLLNDKYCIDPPMNSELSKFCKELDARAATASRHTYYLTYCNAVLNSTYDILAKTQSFVKTSKELNATYDEDVLYICKPLTDIVFSTYATKSDELSEFGLNFEPITCEDFDLYDEKRELKGNIIDTVYTLLLILTPILVIVLGSYDFARAVMAQDQEGLKKATKNFMNRLIALVVFLMLPVVLHFILVLATGSGIFGNDKVPSICIEIAKNDKKTNKEE